MSANKNGTVSEHVRAQLGTANLTTRDELKSGPILGFNFDFLAQPFGDGLLRQRGPLQKVGEAFGKGGLATRNLDRSLQGSNVRFIHDHPQYTTQVVRVNNLGRVTHHNGGCTVVPMPTRRSNAATSSAKPAATSRIRQAKVGPDGKTLGDRVRACMILRARQLGIDPDDYGQKELITEASRATGRNLQNGDKAIMTQQALSLILKNKVSESHASIAFAMVFGVEAAWLQYGIGKPSYIERLLKAEPERAA